MDLCIKTRRKSDSRIEQKNVSILVLMDLCIKTDSTEGGFQYLWCFNPCFNGSMYKNWFSGILTANSSLCFNPCFNGSMYKNTLERWIRCHINLVSILVLMDLCIKTRDEARMAIDFYLFQSLF